MLKHLREKARPLTPIYLAFAIGFILGAAMMASPALAVVLAAAFLVDILRRNL